MGDLVSPDENPSDVPTARSLVDDAFLEEPKGEAEDGPLWSYIRRRKAESDNLSRKMRGKDAAAGKKHSTSSKSERTKR